MNKEDKEGIKSLFINEKKYNDLLNNIFSILTQDRVTIYEEDYIKMYNETVEKANVNLDFIEALTGKSYERHKPYGWWKEETDDNK